MGIKLVKPRENAWLSSNIDLPSKPYRFLNGDELKSFPVPMMVKFQNTRSTEDHIEHEILRDPGSTSVAFLRDEHFMVFGSICTDLDMYAIEQRVFNQGISELDNLWLVDLRSCTPQTVQGQLIYRPVQSRLINEPVRAICMSPSSEHLGILTYNGYSRLHVCPCHQTPKLDSQRIFEEKNLISHSTCCAFSRDGKWSVVGVCSDYFTIRSRSHLVVRQVNLHVGKYSKSKVIYLTRGHLQRLYSRTGVLINLDFSPDSTLLAVSGSQNTMYLLCTKTWKLLSIIDEFTDRSTSLWTIFHPSYPHEQIITCTGFGRLKKWKLQHRNTYPVCDDSLDTITDTQTTVTCCPSFAPNGTMLAVGFSNGKVLILDPNFFVILWVTSPGFHLAQGDLRASISATSLCFSKSCQYLAVGYTRDFITVWSLPRNSFTLKHLCRTLIISVCPANMIRQLPLPSSLKKYLLYTASE